MSNHSGLASIAPEVRYWKTTSMFRLFVTAPLLITWEISDHVERLFW